MLNLLTSPTTAGRTARRFGRLVADAVRSVVAPAALVKAGQPTAAPAPAAAPVAEPAPAPDPEAAAGIYTTADIERACLGYDLASDAARSADRNKRKHKKLLDKIPSGRFGAWVIERKPSARQTPDLAEITRIFAAHGLGPVPMRSVAASLVVKPAPVEAAPAAEQVRELVTA